jgi:hypothetical protein
MLSRKEKLMQNVAHWHGQTLNTALQESPSLVLSFYSYGVILRKQDGDAVSEFAVDPAQIALALGNDMRFDTGIIQTDTLLVRQDGIKKTVVEYRKAQMTGISPRRFAHAFARALACPHPHSPHPTRCASAISPLRHQTPTQDAGCTPVSCAPAQYLS